MKFFLTACNSKDVITLSFGINHMISLGHCREFFQDHTSCDSIIYHDPTLMLRHISIDDFRVQRKPKVKVNLRVFQP